MPWCYATSRDADQWNGNFATKQEAIEEATGEYAGYTDRFFVACGECPDPAEAVPDADYIIDSMADHASEWGEVAEDWPDVSDEAKTKLNELLEGWAREHCPISFFMIDGSKSEEVLIPDEIKALVTK